MTLRDLKRKLSFTRKVIYINHKYPDKRDPHTQKIIYVDHKQVCLVSKVTEYYFELQIEKKFKNETPLRFDFPKRDFIEFDNTKFTLFDNNNQKTITIVFI